MKKVNAELVRFDEAQKPGPIERLQEAVFSNAVERRERRLVSEHRLEVTRSQLEAGVALAKREIQHAEEARSLQLDADHARASLAITNERLELTLTQCEQLREVEASHLARQHDTWDAAARAEHQADIRRIGRVYRERVIGLREG